MSLNAGLSALRMALSVLDRHVASELHQNCQHRILRLFLPSLSYMSMCASHAPAAGKAVQLTYAESDPGLRCYNLDRIFAVYSLDTRCWHTSWPLTKFTITPATLPLGIEQRPATVPLGIEQSARSLWCRAYSKTTLPWHSLATAKRLHHLDPDPVEIDVNYIHE